VEDYLIRNYGEAKKSNHCPPFSMIANLTTPSARPASIASVAVAKPAPIDPPSSAAPAPSVSIRPSDTSAAAAGDAGQHPGCRLQRGARVRTAGGASAIVEWADALSKTLERVLSADTEGEALLRRVLTRNLVHQRSVAMSAASPITFVFLGFSFVTK
jgi:hypothetical protein